MKRILLFASALAGLFSAASCQQEIMDPEVKAGVTYEITLPAGPQTKSENGYATYDLHYEVYKTVDAAALETAPLLFEETVTMTGNTTKLTLDLLNDQDYTVLFWANKQGMDYFDLTDLRQVGVKQAASNNDDRDAFCGKDQLAQHDGAQSKTVELKRPFAQINIATLVNAVDYDINPVSSLVKVKDIPVSYNVFTGEPVGDEGEVEYTVNTVPAGNLTVNGTDYKKVAMNYALVPATADNSATVEVYYEINTANGTVKSSIPNVPVKKNYRTNIIGNLLTSNASYTIELKPGFDEGDFYGPEFVKTPAYDEATKTWTITCRDELLYVAQQVNTGANSFVGQTVKVVNDIDLKNIPWTPIGHSTSVTFRGMFEGAAVTKAATEYPTISNLKIENGNCSGFFGLMCNGGKVRNINFNNVTISGERQLGVVAGQVYGNLEQPTIENVTVDNAVITAVPALDGAVYDNGDKVGGIAGLIGQNAYIKDCTVKNSIFTGYRDMGGIVGCTQNDYPCNLTGNHSENIDFVVTSQYLPYSGNTPHGATGAIRGGTRSNATDVIEGNASLEGTISEVVLVNDAVSLQNAINAAAGETHIKFENDIVGNVRVVQKLGVNIIIDGNGQEFDGTFILEGGSQGNSTETLTFQNINFKHEETGSFYFIDANSAEVAKRYVHNVTVDECTFTGSTDAVALRFRQAYNLIVSNTSVVSGHSLLQAYGTTGIVIDKVEVEAGRGVSLGSSTDVVIKNNSVFTVNSYGVRGNDSGNDKSSDVKIENSTISAAQPVVVRYVNNADCTYTVTLEGATLNPTTEGDYQVVFTNGKDDAEYVKPTGNYALNILDGKTYKQFPEAYPVASWDEFTAALAAGEDWIKLTEDITYSGNYSLKKNIILDLGGKSITMPMFYVFSTSTIKNGTINGKMYVREGANATLADLTFTGIIGDDLSTEAHLQVRYDCNLYAKNCVFSPTQITGSQTKPLSVEGRSTKSVKFENCKFNSSSYKKQVYVNAISGTATIEFNKCVFYKTPNIILQNADFSNLTLVENTKSGIGNLTVTIELPNRTKAEGLTEEELSIVRSYLYNKMPSVGIRYKGESSNVTIK